MAREDFVNSINLNTGTDFPYLVLDVAGEQSHPKNPGFRMMHWHEDLQFIYVSEGVIEVKTLDHAVRAAAGEGVFINKNVVHTVAQIENCHYRSFLFPEHFLSFYPGGPAQTLAARMVGNSRLPLILLAPDGDWQDRALSLLKKLSSLEDEKSAFYPYEVLCLLTSLWLELLRHAALPGEGRESAAAARTRVFLRFISEHYAEPLTLKQLAGSAHVSKSECLRCFKATLRTTPYRYLTRYRLSEAARLLRETDLPIGQISSLVGFAQQSYFGKCFREKTGMSPRAFRAKK